MCPRSWGGGRAGVVGCAPTEFPGDDRDGHQRPAMGAEDAPLGKGSMPGIGVSGQVFGEAERTNESFIDDESSGLTKSPWVRCQRARSSYRGTRAGAATR